MLPRKSRYICSLYKDEIYSPGFGWGPRFGEYKQVSVKEIGDIWYDGEFLYFCPEGGGVRIINR